MKLRSMLETKQEVGRSSSLKAWVTIVALVVTTGALSVRSDPAAQAHVRWDWRSYSEGSCPGNDPIDPIGIIFLGTFKDATNPRPTDRFEAVKAVDEHTQEHLYSEYAGDWDQGAGGQYARDTVDCHESEGAMADQPDVVDPTDPHAVARYHMRLFSVFNHDQPTYWVLGTPHYELPKPSGHGHCIPARNTPGAHTQRSGFDEGRWKFTQAYKRATDPVHEVRGSSPGDSKTSFAQTGCANQTVHQSGHVSWIRWGKIHAQHSTGPFARP